jgi:hypothetical protein
MTAPLPKLNEAEQKIVDQIQGLPQESFMAIMSHMNLISWEYDLEDEEVSIPTRETEPLFLKQGRHKAMYYARMELLHAELAKEEAMKKVREIYANWDKMEKDSPISWNRGKLRGDILNDK